MKKIGIIGAGKIGQFLKMQLERRDFVVPFMISSSQGHLLENLLKKEELKAVGLCIDTRDKGQAAKDYILRSIEAGIPVITCEKGSLSYHYEAIRPHLPMIGYTAVLGGGTKILPYIESRNARSKEIEINIVLNGTLNFIGDKVNNGVSVDKAFKEVCALGSTEPGAGNLAELAEGELLDVSMKTCVFFNTCLACKDFITPNELGADNEDTSQSFESITRLFPHCRMVVTFLNHRLSHKIEFLKKYFDVTFDGWRILAGFRSVWELERIDSWLPSGLGNAVQIVEKGLASESRYTLSGPGAGVEPTVGAMLDDFDRLCR